jgi:hypothetical protein
MHARRKFFFGSAVVAVSVTGIVVFGTPTIFAGAVAPQFPVACKIDATVTFNPALTQSGTHTTNRAAVTTATITGGRLSGCLSAAPATAPGHGDIPTTTVNLPATSLGRIGGVRTFATGYCPAFRSTATLKVLRRVIFDIIWTGGAAGTSVFTTKAATPAMNIDSEVGFALSGRQVQGSYAEKSLNQLTLFIDATDSAALSTGCSANQTVTSVTIDPANSVAIL